MTVYKTGLWSTLYRMSDRHELSADHIKNYIDQVMTSSMMESVVGMLGLAIGNRNTMYRSYTYQYLGTGMRKVPGWHRPDESYGNLLEDYKPFNAFYLDPGYVNEIRMQWSLALIDPKEASIGEFVHAKVFENHNESTREVALPILPTHTTRPLDLDRSRPLSGDSIITYHYQRRVYWVDMGVAYNGNKIEKLTLWERTR